MTALDTHSTDHSPSTLPPHACGPEAVAATYDVDPSAGLSAVEASRRASASGPNQLAEPPKRPAWKAIADQFRNFLVLILLAAAAVSFVVSGELKTPIVIAVVVIINAVLGYVQEHRAERSLEALRRMVVTRSRVRRDGEVTEVPATELVVGDIVLLEAGDRVPADGRLLVAASLEVEEAALTGESQPAAKQLAPVAADAGLGDRTNSLFMNTTVTRGRGEMVVTAIGMDTEIGRIAGLLRATDTDKTPLQHQLDALGRALALLALAIGSIVFLVGLVRGESFDDLFLTAVALAVASVPEGLPAVVAVTLAIGTANMAKRNAIVKRLASVETLGCTSVICSDKTGTLTLNEMTAVELVAHGARYEATGRGYGTDGEIVPLAGHSSSDLHHTYVAMALCADAVVRDGDLVGDPTEGALVVLAAKGGVDAPSVRAEFSRVAEVPFDSTHKFMATFHEMAGSDGAALVRCYVKGAPDVLIARSTSWIGQDAIATPIEDVRGELADHNTRLADQGLRVLAVAQRELDADAFAEYLASGAELIDLVDGLTGLGLVGIVDPPRPEAREAIAQAHAAGIKVKMITGDHAATAAAIAGQLGLGSRAVTGADLDTMSEAELDARIDDIDVFARVAPEHKLRLVEALQARGNVVAMTGDGVNDAPALKTADIGVAMGITGTEVTKEAATMVLADDNFATIVAAVRRGRAIYDNIVTFIRFQLATTLGFGMTFLGATLAGLAGGKPFTALQILWVNLIIDGPPAMALGVDPVDPKVMTRTPRPRSEALLTRGRLAGIAGTSLVMALGTLAVLAWAPDTVATTMAFTTFVWFQLFNILNARAERRSVFTRQTLTNRSLWWCLGGVAAAQLAVNKVGFMRDLFDTVALSWLQIAISIGVASTIVVTEELRKLIVRSFARTK